MNDHGLKHDARETTAAAAGVRARLRRFLATRTTRYALGAVFAGFLIAAESDLDSLPFTFLIAALIATFFYALSARPVFALFMMTSLMTLSTFVSMAKRKFLGMNAHVFDVWFYLAKPDTLLFLGDEFRFLTIAALAAVAAFIGLAIVVYRFDQEVPLRRVMAGGAAMGCIAITPVALPWEADNLSYHNRKYHFASSFFVSLSDIPRLLRTDPVSIRLAGIQPQPPFLASLECKPLAAAPDIILTLSESAVPPAAIPGWRFDASLQDYFKSFDGEVHRARVETHGGGTWVTHTSVTSGLSMADFGWMRPYATMLLRDRLHHGLPAALEKCGYRTAVISPQSYNFVNEGPMLTSLGFRDYIDRSTLNAPTKHEADAFYFGKALDFYQRHLEDDRRPLFLFVITMAAHSPYDFRFKPERHARGEPFGNDAQTDEYLRRLTFAQEDYAAFVEHLRRLNRPALAVQFGDHHPLMTRASFEAAGQPQQMSDWRSRLFETFYAVTPVNFTPAAPLPKVAVLDFAYLGATLIDVAGLPLDAVFEDKLALRALCEGAFHTCADRSAVDRHLARMSAAGLLVDPGRPPATSQTAQRDQP